MIRDQKEKERGVAYPEVSCSLDNPDACLALVQKKGNAETLKASQILHSVWDVSLIGYPIF
jgi:hypothetical protein